MQQGSVQCQAIQNLFVQQKRLRALQVSRRVQYPLEGNAPPLPSPEGEFLGTGYSSDHLGGASAVCQRIGFYGIQWQDTFHSGRTLETAGLA